MSLTTSEMLDSFSVPEKLTEKQAERCDDIRRAAFVLARCIDEKASKNIPVTAEYKQTAIAHVRMAMLCGVEAVKAEAVVTSGRKGFTASASAARAETTAENGKKAEAVSAAKNFK